MSPRTLLRYDQIRRVDRIDSPVDDSQFAQGRYFRANCLSTDSVNNLVMITGVTAGLPDVAQVDITDRSKMPAIGMIVEKSSPTECLVQVVGLVTTLTGLTPGKRYYVGGGAAVSMTVPTPGVGGIAVVQTLGMAVDVDKFLIEPNLFPTVRIG